MPHGGRLPKGHKGQEAHSAVPRQIPHGAQVRGAQDMSGNRAAFSLATFFWLKIAPAFSAFATSLWLAAQKKVARLRVRQPD
jgi:hypothetical protein